MSFICQWGTDRGLSNLGGSGDMLLGGSYLNRMKPDDGLIVDETTIVLVVHNPIFPFFSKGGGGGGREEGALQQWNSERKGIS